MHTLSPSQGGGSRRHQTRNKAIAVPKVEKTIGGSISNSMTQLDSGNHGINFHDEIRGHRSFPLIWRRLVTSIGRFRSLVANIICTSSTLPEGSMHAQHLDS